MFFRAHCLSKTDAEATLLLTEATLTEVPEEKPAVPTAPAARVLRYARFNGHVAATR
jgi:hypothetical protein